MFKSDVLEHHGWSCAAPPLSLDVDGGLGLGCGWWASVSNAVQRARACCPRPPGLAPAGAAAGLLGGVCICGKGGGAGAQGFNVTGMSVGVVCNHSVAYVGGFGWADAEATPKQPASKSTLYQVASNSKAFVSERVQL